jgi:hypothetical protein
MRSNSSKSLLLLLQLPPSKCCVSETLNLCHAALQYQRAAAYAHQYWCSWLCVCLSHTRLVCSCTNTQPKSPLLQCFFLLFPASLLSWQTSISGVHTARCSTNTQRCKVGMTHCPRAGHIGLYRIIIQGCGYRGTLHHACANRGSPRHLPPHLRLARLIRCALQHQHHPAVHFIHRLHHTHTHTHRKRG